MTRFPPDSEFGPDVTPQEARDLSALGDRLVAERPLPRASFRGDLRRRLVQRPNPSRLRVRALAFLVSGVALLAVAALGTANVGPLAPSGGADSAAQTQASVTHH